jgi:hypothetical protein
VVSGRRQFVERGGVEFGRCEQVAERVGDIGQAVAARQAQPQRLSPALAAGHRQARGPQVRHDLVGRVGGWQAAQVPRGQPLQPGRVRRAGGGGEPAHVEHRRELPQREDVRQSRVVPTEGGGEVHHGVRRHTPGLQRLDLGVPDAAEQRGNVHEAGR